MRVDLLHVRRKEQSSCAHELDEFSWNGMNYRHVSVDIVNSKVHCLTPESEFRAKFEHPVHEESSHFPIQLRLVLKIFWV